MRWALLGRKFTRGNMMKLLPVKLTEKMRPCAACSNVSFTTQHCGCERTLPFGMEPQHHCMCTYLQACAPKYLLCLHLLAVRVGLTSIWAQTDFRGTEETTKNTLCLGIRLFAGAADKSKK